MKSLFLCSLAMAVLTAAPGSVGAQALNPAQMPPAMAAQNSGDEANNSPAITQPDPTAPLAVTNSIGDTVVVGANGIYSVHFAAPAWTFTGNLGQVLPDRAVKSGTDPIGQYLAIAFHYTNAVQNAAEIRLYRDSPIVTLNNTTLEAGPNDLAFPRWVNYPQVQNHLSFGNIFSTYNFRQLFDDDFWLFFATNHDAFILSPAMNYMVSSMRRNGDGSISCGINSEIHQLPSGFSHRVILTAQNGINRIYSTWGNALLALGNKTVPPNDAAVELDKVGYWTDNGSTYAYKRNLPLDFRGTLLAMKDEFAKKGIKLGYVQLDSWFYPKGAGQTWNNVDGGIYEYTAHSELFPQGLAAFHQRLGLPMIAHARWLDPASPYRTNYTTSGTFNARNSTVGVVTDPKYWADRMAYLKESGVTVYEQDWLGFRGQPLMNLTDGPAYMNNMAAAAATNGLTMQYCMIHGRHYLQGSLYPNLTSVRTSQDRFDTRRWTEFLFGSRMAQAMGIWPWSDVYMSGETRNLLISTLSAGLVGVGDRVGTMNAENLLKSVRPDGVIVKPDEPLVPTDDTYVNDAQRLRQPFIATTYTDHGNSRAVYVFAYGESYNNLSASFKPAEFGISGNAYVYDYFAGTGKVVNAGSRFNFTTTMPQNTNGGSYFIAVPIGPSGIALLGDLNKFVTRGRKRISSFTDTGVARATVVFAAAETNVTFNGYAPSRPNVQGESGTAAKLVYDPGTHLFTVNVSPENSGLAIVTFSLASVGAAPRGGP